MTTAEPHTIPEQTSFSLPGPRISRITIGRLHNLGNYEHVRYEVTVELPPGTSPASVLHTLDRLVAELEPRGPYSTSEVHRAQRTVSKPEPKLADFSDWGSPTERLDEALRERSRAVELLKRYDEWRMRRDAAQLRFDEFGGTRVYTDAKDRWDDEQ